MTKDERQSIGWNIFHNKGWNLGSKFKLKSDPIAMVRRIKWHQFNSLRRILNNPRTTIAWSVQGIPTFCGHWLKIKVQFRAENFDNNRIFQTFIFFRFCTWGANCVFGFRKNLFCILKEGSLLMELDLEFYSVILNDC